MWCRRRTTYSRERGWLKLACNLLCGFYPSYEKFDHEVEDEWGERVSLENATKDLNEAGPFVWGEKLSMRIRVQVSGYDNEILWYS